MLVPIFINDEYRENFRNNINALISHIPEWLVPYLRIILILFFVYFIIKLIMIIFGL